MIDKDPCNPERSRFVEDLVSDIQDIEDYKKYGIDRENVCVIASYIIQRLSKVKESEGIQVIDDILTYRFNEDKHKNILK
jgi:hypothetical protein